MPLVQAAVRAGQARFRAIMLTSVTTFAGLTPIMLESSAQAQFVIPMAISLAFGVLVATVFTLLLIPAAIVIADDIGRALRRIPAFAARWWADARARPPSPDPSLFFESRRVRGRRRVRAQVSPPGAYFT